MEKELAQAKKAMHASRVNFAKRFDEKMLSAGIESQTFAEGPDATKLVISDVLAGRVRAKQLGDNLHFDALRALGFKTVVYKGTRPFSPGT